MFLRLVFRQSYSWGQFIKTFLRLVFRQSYSWGQFIKTFLRLVFRQSYSWASYTDVPEIGIHTVLGKLYRNSELGIQTVLNQFYILYTVLNQVHRHY
jgi:hypothetical protein